MNNNKAFSVTNWNTYQIIKATDAASAVAKAYPQKVYRLIPPPELTENTVTHIMCCEYEGNSKSRINSCTNDIDKILLMDSMKETFHYQIG